MAADTLPPEPLLGAPPCFFWEKCRNYAQLEKGGKSVCQPCAERMRGLRYPLRPPSREPLYLTGRHAAEALDMVETGRKRSPRAKRR